MILSDRDLLRAIADGRIVVTPDAGLTDRLGPDSIDFRLGHTFLIFERTAAPYIDPRRPESAAGTTRMITMEPDQPFVIQPQQLVLATTVERLRLAPDLLGRLEGRSSLGRLGIIVHSTASLFHPGWDGHPTMELGNLGVMPVALYPGMRVCAFTFEQMTSPAEHPYGSTPAHKYTGQSQALTSRIWEEPLELGL